LWSIFRSESIAAVAGWQASRWPWVLLAILSLSVLTLSHAVFQAWLYMQPCEHCVYIRFAFSCMLLGGFSAAVNPRNFLLRSCGYLLAGYGVVKGLDSSLKLNTIHRVLHSEEPFGVQGCAAEPAFPLGLPLDRWLPGWFKPTGECGVDSPLVPGEITLHGVQQWLVDFYADGWYLWPAAQFINMAQACLVVFGAVLLLLAVAALSWLLTSRTRALRMLVPLSLLAVLGVGVAQAATPCGQSDTVRIWTAPLAARPGARLEVVAVAIDGELAELLVTDPMGRRSKLAAVRGGGPPWSLRGALASPDSGRYRIEAKRAGRVVACTEVVVGGGAGNRGSGMWDVETQAFYAAWVEQLFDAPPEQPLSFPSLAPLLRDPARNFLHGYLGKNEESGLRAEPDCADLPYFLRAYFAWKLGLPISYRACSRGSASAPPYCDPPQLERGFMGTAASAATFRQASIRLMDRVHSGSGRTALHADASDFYPVPLERATLWPGTVFADPYGHTLVIVKWVPQTSNRNGLLLAVDAQPDNSVTRKRFWEGTFLFAATPSAGPGFKAYRPPVAGTRHGELILPANAALDGRAGLPPYSIEQAGLAPEDFYARLERLINPQGLEPAAAYAATLDALMEQLESRVSSVDNGEGYLRAHPGSVIPMPAGAAIFETTGAWEDYATPSRDMRLLIAMQVLADFPERIRRHPELYRLRGQSAVAAAGRIEQLHAQRLQERFITYTRSDGSSWRLSLAEIFARRSALEMAYNPNDCVERRWGAAVGSAELATCRRRAPVDQQARMNEYRPWFRDRQRPPR
jgi:disulfide bond formation protein DsbB